MLRGIIQIEQIKICVLILGLHNSDLNYMN